MRVVRDVRTKGISTVSFVWSACLMSTLILSLDTFSAINKLTNNAAVSKRSANAGAKFLPSKIADLNLLAFGATKEPSNLISNPSFETLRKAVTATKPMPDGWQFYIIASPAEGYCDESKAASGKRSFKFSLREGGKAFLHSHAFDVEPNTRYKVRLLACGSGIIAVEMLWWQSYPEPLTQSKRHRDAAKEEIKLTEKWQPVEAAFIAPEDAKKAYLRIIARDGDVWVDDVEVVRSP